MERLRISPLGFYAKNNFWSWCLFGNGCFELSKKKTLDSSNYATDGHFLLHEKNYFEVVAGKESVSENKEENRRELRDFSARQRLVLSVLYLNISTEYYNIIENVTDPAEAWKLLRDNFRPDNKSSYAAI
ncbi:hypothetical protein TNCT_608401 [Trichonephila clavata]|uniref:Uncharacterized protein n=1 Tax=Trichonephila clavata TaxID=2740835 RepID=A0A8X6IJ77_TRICU|nr:hypothetical protein TNCT_608401 [Trichonephila clavata]